MSDTQQLNMIQAVNRAIDDAMAASDKVLMLGEEVGDKEGGGIVGVSKGLSSKYGDERVRSTPISEQAIVGAAIGASLAGYRPIAEIMLMNFTPVCMDMITNHAAKLRFMSGGQTHVPMVLRTMTGTGFGTGGQHSDYLEAWYAHTPGLKVVCPSNPADAYGLMLSAIEDDDPVIWIEPMALYWTPGPVDFVKVPLGKARIAREGADVTIIAHARMVVESLTAAETLAAEGVSVEVIDLRTISPWDRDTVFASVGKTGRAVVVHEAVREFGVGAEISAEIAEAFFGKLKAPVKRLGGPFAPVPFSKPLESAYAPNAGGIADTIRSIIA
ncbi:alpha-ketoacid dehydrogenase subunit beta [Sphingobium sp. JS3065]|uniref:alpha-ketoacid dehydrogenase subunit beta n=1 Tax=Sphingobium sp. JS3065 TaxID=2970925 RepID=UPI00226551B0|nr:alpha-ketoacid dehydrogenase subunit beta [Sphingobium sp. JS3065]UZW57069.1 alpha-ketoacid dehydrogenase subunit beta [Sphingobium sp. JS3065]